MLTIPFLSRLPVAKRDQYLLFGAMLVIASGNTGLQSVLPAIGRSLKVPDPLVATAFSFSALLWAMAAPFWAKRIGRIGARRMVLTGLAGFIGATALCALSLTAGLVGWVTGGVAFAGFIVGRTVYGSFGAAAPPAAQAQIVMQTPRDERVKALSLLASAFGLGTILGPAFAPFFLLPVVGLAGPLYMFALAGGAMWLAVLLFLSDFRAPHLRAVPAAEPGIGSEPVDAPADADELAGEKVVRWRDSRIWPWMLSGLVAGHAQAIVGQTLAFLLIDRIAVAPAVAQPLIGIVLMAGAASALLAQWGVIPRLDMQPRSVVLWGAGLAALGCAGVAFAPGLHAIGVSFAIASLGFGFLRPGFTAGASLAVEEAEQGSVAGRVTAANGLVFMFGPAVGILMYEVWRPLPYVASAIALLVLLFYCLGRLPKGLTSR
ncbi:MAG: MFS transporter [Sphingobium sp.]